MNPHLSFSVLLRKYGLRLELMAVGTVVLLAATLAFDRWLGGGEENIGTTSQLATGALAVLLAAVLTPLQRAVIPPDLYKAQAKALNNRLGTSIILGLFVLGLAQIPHVISLVWFGDALPWLSYLLTGFAYYVYLAFWMPHSAMHVCGFQDAPRAQQRRARLVALPLALAYPLVWVTLPVYTIWLISWLADAANPHFPIRSAPPEPPESERFNFDRY